MILGQLVKLVQRRRGRPDLEAHRQHHHARRHPRRGRPRRRAAHVPAAGHRHHADVRPRRRHRAVDGEPRLLRAVRARAGRVDRAQGGRARASRGCRSLDASISRCSCTSASSSCCARSPTYPDVLRRRRRRCAHRTASPPGCATSRRASTASTATAGCSPTTPRSPRRGCGWPRRAGSGSPSALAHPRRERARRDGRGSTPTTTTTTSADDREPTIDARRRRSRRRRSTGRCCPPRSRGVDLDALAAEFGTPLYVYDEDAAAARGAASTSTAFGAEQRGVRGQGVPVHRDGAARRRGGLAPRRRDRRRAARRAARGLPAPSASCSTATTSATPRSRPRSTPASGAIVADSFDELDRLERSCRRFARPTVLVRVTPGVEAHTHEYIETGTDDSKFGFTVVERRRARRGRSASSTSPALRFGGIHCHIGSQVFRARLVRARRPAMVGAFADECERATGVDGPTRSTSAAASACAYLADDDPPTIERSRRTRRAPALRRRPRLDAPRLMVEPGRSIAAAAGHHALPRRHDQGDPRRRAPTSRSTAG